MTKLSREGRRKWCENGDGFVLEEAEIQGRIWWRICIGFREKGWRGIGSGSVLQGTNNGDGDLACDDTGETSPHRNSSSSSNGELATTELSHTCCQKCV